MIGVDQAEAHQPAPVPAGAPHGAEVREGQQQGDADQDLDEGDEVRAHSGDPLGDQRGQTVEQRGQQCLADAGQVRAAAREVARGDARDEDQAGEGQHDPAHLAAVRRSRNSRAPSRTT